jgi:hypothetical protein
MSMAQVLFKPGEEHLASGENLEGVQESDQRVSLTWREPPEAFRSILSLIFVTLDGIFKRQ